MAAKITTRLTPMTWFAVLAVIAGALALGLPPDPHDVSQLHTTSAGYRLAVAGLLIPYVFIWYLGFYAFAKLKEYSRALGASKDGVAFRKITVGMGTLAFSLVIPTIIALVVANIASHHRGFEAAAAIINNYLALFPGLVSFLLLYNGARALVRTTKTGTQKLDIRWYAPVFLLLSVVFAHLTIENQTHSHPYHLALWLLIVTFIVPYIYGWLVGLLCAYDLHLYATTVRGTLYQRAVRQFAAGITVAIIGSIAIQFVTITLTERLKKSLGEVLLADYGLLIIVAAGLILMALGTRKLKLIEEI